MSLINDMLRDLGHQDKETFAPELDREAMQRDNNRELFEQSSMALKKRTSWWPSLLVFFAVLLLLLTARYVWNGKEEVGVNRAVTSVDANSSPSSLGSNVSPPNPITLETELTHVSGEIEPEQVAASPEIESSSEALAVYEPVAELGAGAEMAPKSPTLNEKKASDTASQFGSAQEDLSTAKLSLEVERQISNLLLQAEQALSSDRLTAPIEDSAYQYYQEVLRLDKNNDAAQQGLLRVAARYLQMTGLGDNASDKVWSEQAIQRAGRFIKRAQWVAPEYKLAEEYRKQLAIVAANPVAEISHVAEVAEVAGNTRMALAEDVVNNQTPPVASEQSAKGKESQLSVSPNEQWQDQQKVAEAQQLLTQGETAAAEMLLQNFIASAAAPRLSAGFLLELYSQQQRVDQLDALLRQAAYIGEPNKTYFAAKLALLQNDEAKARRLLEASLAAAEKNENYRALLAGLYQRGGFYSQAKSSYRRLLETFGDKPAYWLGLALALDALDQKSSALQAFKRLNDYTDLQVEVRQYVAQRIQSLEAS